MNIRRFFAAFRLPTFIATGLLAVTSAMGQSGTPATPIALKLTVSENAMIVSTTNSTTWDSLIVSHRAVSPLGDVHLAALASAAPPEAGQLNVLKEMGAKLWTDQTTFIPLPEGGIYWAFAHNEAGWASARVELHLPEGRLAVWRDAATNHLLVRISVPSQVPTSTKLALLLDNVQISEQAVSEYAKSGTGYDASNLSADSKTLWLSIPVTPDAKGTLKAVFELTPKPIELEVLRPTTSAVLAGASHLLERLTKEKGNPLLNSSAPGTSITYTPATQLGYWKSLVETVPTWQGYGELFEKLLTKKKGTHTTWDGTEAELSASDLSSAMSAIAASALTPRLSQQNLTGPVYYGAYTRAMLDNDLHFALKEGEALQVLWQGSVDLYYYEPNPTDPTSHDSILTKLSLPNNPDGTAPKDPYGTLKQLILTKGTSTDLYAKIANNGLWVKGVEWQEGGYNIEISRTTNLIQDESIINPVPTSSFQSGISALINDAPIAIKMAEKFEITDWSAVLDGQGGVLTMFAPIDWVLNCDERVTNTKIKDGEFSLGIPTFFNGENFIANECTLKKIQVGEEVYYANLILYQISGVASAPCSIVSKFSSGSCRVTTADEILETHASIPNPQNAVFSQVSTNLNVDAVPVKSPAPDATYAVVKNGIIRTTPMILGLSIISGNKITPLRVAKDDFGSIGKGVYALSRMYFIVNLEKDIEYIKFLQESSAIAFGYSPNGDGIEWDSWQGDFKNIRYLSLVCTEPGALCQAKFQVKFKKQVEVQNYEISVIDGAVYDEGISTIDWNGLISSVTGIPKVHIYDNTRSEFERSFRSSVGDYLPLEAFSRNKAINTSFEYGYWAATWAGAQSKANGERLASQYPDCYENGVMPYSYSSPALEKKCKDAGAEREYGGWILQRNGRFGFIVTPGGFGQVPGIISPWTPLLGHIFGGIHSHPTQKNQNMFSSNLRAVMSTGPGGDFAAFANMGSMINTNDMDAFEEFLAAPKIPGFANTGKILYTRPSKLQDIYENWIIPIVASTPSGTPLNLCPEPPSVLDSRFHEDLATEFIEPKKIKQGQPEALVLKKVTLFPTDGNYSFYHSCFN